MPRWGQVAALRQAIREQRGKVAGAGEILWRRKKLVLACVGVVLALTAAYVSTLATVYQAEALVALGDPAGRGTSAADQLELTQSRAMAERLADRLDLHLLPEFRPEAASRGFRLGDLLPAAILDRLPQAWANSLGAAPSNGEMTDEQRAARLWQAVVEATMSRIRAEVTSPAVLGFRFLSENPQVAAAGANGLADLYLEQHPAPGPSTAPDERATREREIERLRASIRDTEQAIAAARGGADTPATADNEQTRLSGELAFWQRERAELEARLQQMQATLQSGANPDDAALAGDAERLSELQASASELQQLLAGLTQQYGEDAPQVAELRAQLAILERERRAQIEQLVELLQEELAMIQARETALQGKIEALEQQGGQDQAAAGLEMLEQKLEAERAALAAYLEQAAGQLTTDASAAAPPDVRSIQPAVVPDEPSYPRLMLIWSAAAVGALLFGILLAFALEGLQRVRA